MRVGRKKAQEAQKTNPSYGGCGGIVLPPAIIRRFVPSTFFCVFCASLRLKRTSRSATQINSRRQLGRVGTSPCRGAEDAAIARLHFSPGSGRLPAAIASRSASSSVSLRKPAAVLRKASRSASRLGRGWSGERRKFFLKTSVMQIAVSCQGRSKPRTPVQAQAMIRPLVILI